MRPESFRSDPGTMVRFAYAPDSEHPWVKAPEVRTKNSWKLKRNRALRILPDPTPVAYPVVYANVVRSVAKRLPFCEKVPPEWYLCENIYCKYKYAVYFTWLTLLQHKELLELQEMHLKASINLLLQTLCWTVAHRFAACSCGTSCDSCNVCSISNVPQSMLLGQTIPFL